MLLDCHLLQANDPFELIIDPIMPHMEWNILLLAQTEELTFRDRIEHFKFIHALCDENLVFAALLGKFCLQGEAGETEKFFFRAGSFLHILALLVLLGRYACLLVLIIPLRADIAIVLLLCIIPLVDIIEDLTGFRRGDTLSIQAVSFFKGHDFIVIGPVDIDVALAGHFYQRAFFHYLVLISAKT